MKHLHLRRDDERGMSTAEYSVGTLGAVSIAGLLIAPNPIGEFVSKVFREAARLVVTGELEDVLTLPRLIARAVGNLIPW